MISVCVATYNGEKYIAEQILSILSQLSDKDEIIVSDDGSTDKTIEIIQKINDSRIIILRHKTKGKTGFEKAKNNFCNALGRAKGDYIFLSDQDDIWHPQKVEIFTNYLNQYECVQSDCELMSPTPYTTGALKQYDSLIGNIIHLPFRGCNMAITRNLLDIILPIPDSVITHDAWIGCCAILRKSYIKINDELLIYRIHDNNVSVRKNRNTIWFKLSYRFTILYYVLKRCYLNIK